MKHLITLIAAFLLVVIFAVPVFAQSFDPFAEVCTGETSTATACIDSNKPQEKNNNALVGPNGLITKAILILSAAIGIASIIIIMYGGLRYILSGNDSGQVNKAKDTVLYAVVGLLVAISAQMIVSFVLNRL